MPIKIPATLPAYDALRAENVFAITEDRATHQDIRPLRIAIVNLMPTTLDTEIQLLRLLGNSPLQVDVTLLRMGSHDSRNAPEGHLERFYVTSDTVLHERFDGLIITGAPVETLPFEEVDYWKELAGLIDYSSKNVFSTLHICWGAQAGLYRRYGVGKKPLASKLFGVFPHAVNEKLNPLFRGFDDEFLAPQSRHTEVDRNAIASRKELTIESESAEAGVFIVTARDGREIYVSGHLEYDPMTLDREYKRDVAKGLPIAVPRNYYPGDDPRRPPLVRWRAHAHLFFSNWLNFVYQETPYRLEDL
ncbi:MAG: homoserine O-succinyltransferase [Treponema sp. GWB1_62_6]|nr:MAG: homoserine O-succinyltransferase [Treponema sp. GWA1_62_8]OHE63740.1 MAG: homoserine O-succinyltransferase [Treponema sp. GWC1_61_84]OHE69271.1 MAG: homoserine O-succinyltransferase [Treponema sp. RIFOXYC1_FULL_61_9]OHE72590.1 MAG: homoserine O-succinyltransferase [Treponema sp. GWB1_62_6]HCM28020.1 homoserine O-succinyltransferase [Treponema sp.]